MTEMVVTPEDEARAAVREQYDMIVAQQKEYGWRAAIVDTGDYLVIFVRIEKPQGRTFVMRLRCDDYPEQAPELRFVAPAAIEVWCPSTAIVSADAWLVKVNVRCAALASWLTATW